MESLIAFLKKFDYVFVFLLLEAGAIVFISQNSNYQGSKLVSAGNAVAGRCYGVVHSVGDYFGLRRENELLAAENARLRAELESSYMRYDRRQFVHNDTVYRQRYSYTEAQVVKNSWSQQNNYIMINKGRIHGIVPDMAVISPQGIVGVVVNATANFATVMPVLHANSRNSVKLTRTSTNGSLVWEGGDFRYATVVDIPTTYKLYKNDTIVTSGMANDFPEGVMVGFVESLSSAQGSGFYNVKVRLATEFNKLDHVYIIDNHFKAEQDSLMRLTQKGEEK
ncbi:MAG: rod shape-determining protein MreC [Bacteroidales bacterium]|nr:rod shape-determining protein MreC [Bacteroidales bacterium]MBP5644601.1 rod shape-determining protein MreC [Bacteroidales bacterium]